MTGGGGGGGGEEADHGSVLIAFSKTHFDAHWGLLFISPSSLLRAFQRGPGLSGLRQSHASWVIGAQQQHHIVWNNVTAIQFPPFTQIGSPLTDCSPGLFHQVRMGDFSSFDLNWLFVLMWNRCRQYPLRKEDIPVPRGCCVERRRGCSCKEEVVRPVGCRRWCSPLSSLPRLIPVYTDQQHEGDGLHYRAVI